MIHGCGDVDPLLDGFLADELLVETNAELIAHLESCPACASNLEARRRFLSELRKALAVDTDLTVLQMRIHTAIAGESRRLRWIQPLLGLAAMLAVCLGGVALLQRSTITAPPGFAVSGIDGDIRPARVDQNAFRDVAYNHLHCGINRPVPVPPTRAEIEQRLLRFAALVDSVDYADRGYHLADAHVCPNGERRLVHLVLRRDGKTVSIFVSEKVAGDLPSASIERIAGVGLVHDVEVDGFEMRGVEGPASFAMVVTDARDAAQQRFAGLYLSALSVAVAAR